MKDMHELIQLYLARNDDEINTLEKERARGHKKPKSSRQHFLEALKERESNEYVSGLGQLQKELISLNNKLCIKELPDMTNGKTLELLREWDGDKNSMSRIKTIRVRKPLSEESKAVTPAAKEKSDKVNDLMDTEQNLINIA